MHRDRHCCGARHLNRHRGRPSVATQTWTATATDQAGNSSTSTATYTVSPWTLKGFYAPVDIGNVVNTVKGGSTIPLKFKTFKGATELTSTSAIKSFTTQKMARDASTTLEDAIEVTTTGGTSLRFDATGGQFIQNWQTPKQAGNCYKATMTAQDNQTITALFKLK